MLQRYRGLINKARRQAAFGHVSLFSSLISYLNQLALPAVCEVRRGTGIINRRTTKQTVCPPLTLWHKTGEKRTSVGVTPHGPGRYLRKECASATVCQGKSTKNVSGWGYPRFEWLALYGAVAEPG